jgi:hypothetical protein
VRFRDRTHAGQARIPGGRTGTARLVIPSGADAGGRVEGNSTTTAWPSSAMPSAKARDRNVPPSVVRHGSDVQASATLIAATSPPAR